MVEWQKCVRVKIWKNHQSVWNIVLKRTLTIMNLASFLKTLKFWDVRGQNVRENSDKIAKIQRDYWAYGV